MTWPQPAAIIYGSALGNGQLNATANVPGTFVYTPPAGIVLPVGNGQTPSVVFTPTDQANYNGASASTAINVNAAPQPPSGVQIVVTKVPGFRRSREKRFLEKDGAGGSAASGGTGLNDL